MSFDNLINRATDLYNQLIADEELKKKALSFASHVTGIDFTKQDVDEEKGIIREYLKIETDVGDIYIPLQLYVIDATYIHDTATKLHQFVSQSMLPIIKDIYESVKAKSKDVKGIDTSSIMPVIAETLGKAMLIITDDKIMGLASKIGENTSNIELVCDTSDERTFDLVIVDNVKNTELITSMTIDILDFIKRMWDSVIYPFINAMLHA